MGVLDNISGLGFLEGMNIAGFFSGVGKILTFILLLFIASVVIGLVFYRKKASKKANQSIHFFEEVAGQMIPIEDCTASELTIPNSSIRVFYIKDKDLYLPRGTRKMGKNSFWYGIRKNRELVNFTMKNLNEAMTEAGLEFDHTDMRYANKNLKKIIDENFRQKSKKWWQEYKDVVSTVIFIFVMSIAFYLLINKIGGLMSQANQMIQSSQGVVDRVTDLLVKLDETRTICGGAGSSSGITPA